ncbi:hypothetical protein [Natronorubrum texcoconense]|uniref:Envelope protein N-terminal domain-containing protein n=1 Tax=Natronorubrum texcoconense TaxID=1095776 RepID=A0A1G9E3L0_9EURY|nr:hypothetical protein [Natronorubrum texcoconense]SDK70735.1 hypothetical protein SAMN04515672_3745 [Natronorubrum texcoconense]
MAASGDAPDRGDGPKPTAQENEGMTRRGLLARGGTIAGGSVATIAFGGRVVPRFSPVGRAAACPPCAVAGAALVGYVAGVSHARYATDSEEVVDALEFEDHLRLYNEAREINEVTDESLLASIERDASGLISKAIEQAIIDVYHEVISGGDRDDAEEAAESAIAEIFSAVEMDLVTRMTSLTNGVLTQAENEGVAAYSYDDDNEINEYYGGDGTRTETYILLNGDNYDYELFYHAESGGAGVSDEIYGHFDPFEVAEYQDGRTGAYIEEPDPEDYDIENPEEYGDYDYVDGYQQIFDSDEYADVYEAIHDGYDQALSEVEALLETHYDGIEAGDLSIQDMLSPSAMDETIAEAESWGELALYFRQLGLAEAEAPVVLEVDTSGVDEVEDDEQELEGLLGWTVPSAVEDTYIPIGTQINPSTYPGEFRMAAEWEGEDGETDADMLSLVGPFTVTEVDESISGAEYLHFDEREVVQSDTDPERAAEIYTEHQEAEAQAREQTIEVVVDDGGSGVDIPNPFDGDAGGLMGLGLIGVVLLAVIGIVTDLVPGLGE